MAGGAKQWFFCAVRAGMTGLLVSIHAQMGMGDIVSNGAMPVLESATTYTSGNKSESKVGMFVSSGMTSANPAQYTEETPGFDIVDVKVLCKLPGGSYCATRFQPLVSDEVGVEARLDNFRMSPSNIAVYVTYYVGTNVWGVDNWPAGETVTKRMYPTLENPLVYQTSTSDDIPFQPQDQVVQYLVWSSYLGGIPSTERQKTFENPSWYYPVDLNQNFVSQGWSPYYIVYGAPEKTVWINEINATDYPTFGGVPVVSNGIGGNLYLEIAVPAAVDLAGWKIDLVTTENYVTQTIEIPSGLAAQEAVTNGYAFFVVGEYPKDRAAGVPPLPKLDCGYRGFADVVPHIQPGGVRLRRPMGMYEQALAYDWKPEYGDSFSGALWAANDPEGRFVYVGREHNGGSLCTISGIGATLGDWGFPRTWTPGWANEGQTIPPAEIVLSTATPDFSPRSGTTATNTLAVSIACETDGATIRYTLDGSEPSASSPVYSRAITLASSATIKAKAFKPGLLNSFTSRATYTIVAPRFDIAGVKVLCKGDNGAYSATCKQPLYTDTIGVEARIANTEMNPSNIEMFVSYYVGTNVWGAENWPADQVVTKPMYPTSEDIHLFRTSTTNDIPAQAPDQVVQYRVWTKYWVGVPRTKYQDTTEPPPLFYQVDLNQVFAAQGWSPYYIVYGQSGSAAWPLDMVSIKSGQANMLYAASGTNIDFTITLAGKFQLGNTGGGSYAFMPEIRLVVNGGVAYASLYSMLQYRVANGTADRTDLVFRYIVQPGDMAQPLTIYGPPSVPYQFFWNGWEIRNTATDKGAVWKFNTGLSLPAEGEVCDLDLTAANIQIRTLSFDAANTPSPLTQKAQATWRVTTVNPPAGPGVDFYVWTPSTNLLQIGAISNQTALLVNLPAGATQVDFPVKALGVGTTDIYLQRVQDYQNNGISGVTNAIKCAITCVAPPPPLMRVVMTDTGTDKVTMDESASTNTGSFHIELSESFTNDVWVRIDTTPVGQKNVTFDASPITCIPAGSVASPVVRFSVPDGYRLYAPGDYYMNHVFVTLIPVITNADAAATYTRVQNGTVSVRNVSPVLLQPSGTEMRVAQRGFPVSFEWSVRDSIGDAAAGLKVTWSFTDGSPDEVTYGATGQIVHTFSTLGSRFVMVYAEDKDHGSTEINNVWVKVIEPSVSVVTSSAIFPETGTNVTGSLMVSLSTAFTEDVWVGLHTSLGGESQSNLVLSTDVVRIPQGFTNAQEAVTFSILDGTRASTVDGITITPVVTNASAAAIYAACQSAKVYVTNLPPLVAQPSGVWYRADPPYDRVVVGRPFTFNYAICDVSADRDSMVVKWKFDDGQRSEETGAIGQVTHTFSSLGWGTVLMQARDKDGGLSEEVEFGIKVIPVPPPPGVSVVAPSGLLQEMGPTNMIEVRVQLTEAFSNDVAVGLAMTPANSVENGAAFLATNQVRFAAGETAKTVSMMLRDGTALSGSNGFTVTPTVLGDGAAVAYYTAATSAVIRFQNASPVIQYPFASGVTEPPLYTVLQNEPWGFNWSIGDVALDLPALRVQWDFGDGVTQQLSGAFGFVAHIYLETGDKLVRVVATDKDGGTGEVIFKIRVLSQTGGFDRWAGGKGLSGDRDILFGLDRDGDGVANGFEYAFGTNLTGGVPLLAVRFVGGRPVVETPKRNPDSTVDVDVTVQGCTNLPSGDWSLPMGPSEQSGKPDNRDWFSPQGIVPGKAFFRLRAVFE